MTDEVQDWQDEALIRRFRETGDGEFFKELFVRYRKRVFLACKAFFSDASMAEDAVQETFLRIYKNPRGFQGGDFCAWLMRISRNICIDMWRTRQRRPACESELLERAAPTDWTTSPEVRESARRVAEGIKSLSTRQRECLELRIDGYSYDEIAAQAGLTSEAVKSHIQNGRRMLWKRLQRAESQSA